MLSKCIDLISILCNSHAEHIQNAINKSNIMDILLTLILVISYLIKLNNYEIKHYVFALIGDLTKSNITVLMSNIDQIMTILINHLECPPSINKYDSNEMAKLYVCNNTCWTIGLLANTYNELLSNYTEPIMIKLLKILCVPRVISH